MNNNSKFLTLREKLGYGFGDLASVLYWQTFMLYFTYFYTDVFLLPAAVAATIFLVSRVFDGINDPVMGMIADRTNTKWGKFRPYLLWISVPFAIAGVLVFTTPNLGMTGKIIWAYVTFNLIMILYTAINIPYTSLLGVISPNSEERTMVSSVKFMFAFAAGIIISATLLPMAKALGKGDTSLINAKIEGNSLFIQEGEKGNARLIISATDKAGQEQKQEFNFKVNPAENNVPVVVNPIQDIDLENGFGSYEVSVDNIFAGNMGQEFEYSAKSTNSEIITAQIENKKLTITEKNVGNAEIILTAKDKQWGETEYIFNVNVSLKGNANPVLKDSTYIFNLNTGFENHAIDLNSMFGDPDGDALSYTAESSNKKVITPNVTGSKLSFLENRSGITDLKIVARDSRGGQMVHLVRFIVKSESNNPPFINQKQGNIVQNEGFESFTLNIGDLFTDVENEELTYNVEVISAAKGWQRSFIIIGVAAIIFFFIAFKSTRERVQPPKSQVTSVKKDLLNLVTNTPWLILLAVTLTFILFVAVRGSVTVHYFKYFIGTQDLNLPFLGAGTYDFETLASAYNTIGQISAFIGVLIAAWFAKIVGKKKAFILIFLIAIFSTGIVYFLKPEQLGLIFFFQITGSITGGPLSVLIWAMYADTADYGEWKQKIRSTGLIFSASTMSQKIGWALGAFVALTLMAQLGFKPNEVQSFESVRGLLLLFTLIPAGVGLLSIIISMAYPLTDKKVLKITEELQERRRLAEPKN